MSYSICLSLITWPLILTHRNENCGKAQQCLEQRPCLVKGVKQWQLWCGLLPSSEVPLILKIQQSEFTFPFRVPELSGPYSCWNTKSKRNDWQSSKDWAWAVHIKKWIQEASPSWMLPSDRLRQHLPPASVGFKIWTSLKRAWALHFSTPLCGLLSPPHRFTYLSGSWRHLSAWPLL